MWRAKWTDIITLFDYPAPIRKAIYTTNAIESVNSAIRQFARNRKINLNEESALKLVHMAIHQAPKKRTVPVRQGKQAILSRLPLARLFSDMLRHDTGSQPSMPMLPNASLRSACTVTAMTCCLIARRRRLLTGAAR